MLVGMIPIVWLVVSLAVAHTLTRRSQIAYAEPLPHLDWGTLEAHRLTTADGQQIGAWFVRGMDDAPSILLVHGIGANRSACLGRARLLATQGCSVLMITLRAHGDSTGEVNDMGYSARQDVVAGVEFLERRSTGKPIIVHGLSMGGAAAVFASAELADRVQGYVLESPYRDLKTAVRNRTEHALPPILDRLAYIGLLAVAPLVLPDLDKLSLVEAIGGVPPEVQVLILAGGKDPVARPEEAKAILDSVRTHGRLVIFEQAGHLNFPETCPGLYERSLLDFLRHVGSPSSPGPGSWRRRTILSVNSFEYDETGDPARWQEYGKKDRSCEESSRESVQSRSCCCWCPFAPGRPSRRIRIRTGKRGRFSTISKACPTGPRRS
jgi:alpha-beta hydrolase superfamily lysophospholipase